MNTLPYLASSSEISPQADVRAGCELEHPVFVAARAEVHADVRLGRFAFVNFDTVLYARVQVGAYASIGRGCEIGVGAHPLDHLSTHTFQYHPHLFARVPAYVALQRVPRRPQPLTVIGPDVWIGAQAIVRAIVRAGVRIGAGAVVGANAVVTQDVEPYTIVAGSPARVLRRRFDEDLSQALLDLAWWDLPLELLDGVPFDDPWAAVEMLRARRAAFSRASSESTAPA